MQINLDHVPVGKSGEWAISEFEVKESDAKFENIRAMVGGGRHISPGKYKRLTRNGRVIMSNTPAEIMDHRTIVRKHGSILIHGLGLGMVLTELVRRGACSDITVIEKSKDVIDLVGPVFSGHSIVQIIHADAFTWSPPKGKRYNAVWHDIWDDLCSDNLPEMATLHRRYGRRCDWQDSWGKELCKRGR